MGIGIRPLLEGAWRAVMDEVSLAGTPKSFTEVVPVATKDANGNNATRMGVFVHIEIVNGGSTDSVQMEAFACRDLTLSNQDTVPFDEHVFDGTGGTVRRTLYYDWQQCAAGLVLKFTRVGTTDTFTISVDVRPVSLTS